MKTAYRNRVVRGGVFAAAVTAAAILVPLTGRAGPTAQAGYIALGDSIEDPGGGVVGYVVPFGNFLLSVLGTAVEIHNFGQSGAETRDILLGQVPPALAEIQNHRPFGLVISWGGGGNDLTHFILSPQAAACRKTTSCLARINALLNEAEQTINVTISALRAAAGADTPILMRTQYNGLARSGCPAGGAALANIALEGAPGTPLTRGLNDRIRTVAANHGAKVVELFPLFFANPDALIAADCIHPTDAGYDVILLAFTTTFLQGP